MGTRMTTTQQLLESYNRCSSEGDFWGTFYEIFIASSPEIGGMFKQTDFTLQKRMVQRSLQTIIMYIHTPENPDIIDEMDRIARIHDRNHINVRPELYNFWISSLLQAIEQHDPFFDETIKANWEAHLEPVIRYLQDKY